MTIDFKKPIPLYLQIKDDLRSRIRSGALPVGSKVGSQEELARSYRVSLITVKKALADLIREGVLYSRVGKGTYVSRTPAEFTLSKTKALGIVLTDLTSPFFSKIVRAVEETASRHGYNILLSNSSNRAEKEESQIRHFIELGVSGLVIASMTHAYRASKALRDLHKKGFPYVMVSYISDRDIFRVVTDHRAGGRMATEHLLRLGYTRVGYVNGEQGNLVGEERRLGYLDALAAYGIDPNPRYQFRLPTPGERNDLQSGVEVGVRIAALRERPEALFVYNDLAALGVEQALQKHDLHVPDDVAIVGFDDIGPAEYAPVPLTTIRQATDKIGLSSVDVLLKRIAGREPPVVTVLKPEIVVRESCGAHRHGQKMRTSQHG